jgi:outer membrane biosynthesis protein TonB
MVGRVTRLVLAVAILLIPAALVRSQDGATDHTGCAWSSVWPEVNGGFPRVPESAKLTDSKRKKGSIKRPESDVARTIRGTWTAELVVDDKGDVRDAKIMSSPVIDPPWPEYEEAVLKSLRTWKYSPVRINGQARPNCTTVTITDR